MHILNAPYSVSMESIAHNTNLVSHKSVFIQHKKRLMKYKKYNQNSYKQA